MKTYQVTLKRTFYAVFEVEASNRVAAKELAWKELEKNPKSAPGYGSWEHDCTEEKQQHD
jgi:hypothetical protein